MIKHHFKRLILPLKNKNGRSGTTVDLPPERKWSASHCPQHTNHQTETAFVKVAVDTTMTFTKLVHITE